MSSPWRQAVTLLTQPELCLSLPSDLKSAALAANDGFLTTPPIQYTRAPTALPFLPYTRHLQYRNSSSTTDTSGKGAPLRSWHPRAVSSPGAPTTPTRPPTLLSRRRPRRTSTPTRTRTRGRRRTWTWTCCGRRRSARSCCRAATGCLGASGGRWGTGASRSGRRFGGCRGGRT